MKFFLRSVFLGTITLMVMALSARASLIAGTDPSFGANSLTIDTQTELAWLNLSFTAGFSYNQALADLQPGGMFSGYTFASSQQVTGLFADAGISVTGNYALSTPAISTLISLVGSNDPAYGEPGFVAISGTAAPGLAGVQEAPAIYAYGDDGTVVYFVSGGTGAGSTDYGDSTSYPDLGAWLMKPVPEPGIGSIGIVGLIACAIMGRLIFRQII